MKNARSFDTETTGIDPWHGTQPFLLTSSDADSNILFWEWEVDPLTRKVRVPAKERREVQELLDDTDWCIFQNAKFDVRMLSTVDIHVDWKKVHETLLAAHAVNSSKFKDLTSSALYYLDLDIKPYEDKLEEIMAVARRKAKKLFPKWSLAEEDRADMPSAKKTVWKYDTWLPRQMYEALKAETLFDTEDIPEEWATVTSDYANVDSEATILLFFAQKEILERTNRWDFYLQRLKALPIAYEMEEGGITYSGKRLDELSKQYEKESKKSGQICTDIALDYEYELKLPKTGNNKSLLEFCFGVEDECPECEGSGMLGGGDKGRLRGCSVCKGQGFRVTYPGFNLPIVKTSKKTGAPSLDKDVLEYYMDEFDQGSEEEHFTSALREKRQRDTAVTYMKGYRRFAQRLERTTDWFVLHPSLNPATTHTLRWSSQNPNEQNISKKKGFNLRYAFGPAPGREWWSLDYDNLELRIPAYECREPAMLELFEHPNDPPFYGSYHLLIFSILYPDIFGRYGAEVKEMDEYKSTLYQWTKNGNFAELYGAVDTGDGKSTADRAFHYPGAQAIVAKRLKKKAALNQKYIQFARKHGYVETLPDVTVNPRHGYRLYCGRTKWGNISPTIPLNYHVQGTACWVIQQAMLKVHEYLSTLPGYYMIMQVHDELVFDFPFKKNKRNLPKINKIRLLMESCGKDIGIPLTCGVDYHPDNWSMAA